MGFRNGAYATVWEVNAGGGNYSDVRISISRKNKQSGEYENEFSGTVRFIGDAHSKATYLGERSRIKLGECDVTNRYNKEKKVTYTNYAVFDFEVVTGTTGNSAGNGSHASQSSHDFLSYPDDNDLPFN